MAKQKTAKSKGQKNTPSKRKAGAGARAMARSRGGKRKTAGAKTPRGKAARKQAKNPPRPGKRKGAAPKRAAKKTAGKKRTGPARRSSAAKAGLPRRSSSAKAGARAGGTGRESELAQTPETGRTVRGRTNPMPTKRSTGTAAGAGSTRRAPGLERARKQLREIEETVEGPPSSLDMNRNASAARSGRQKMKDSIGEHHET